MRVVKFGELKDGDWFIYGVTPFRSGHLVAPNNPIPCINLLTSRVEYFYLDDIVLVIDQEDIVKLDGHIRKEEQRPHGEWKPINEEYKNFGLSGYRCSKCNWGELNNTRRFCSNCGAEMSKEGEAE